MANIVPQNTVRRANTKIAWLVDIRLRLRRLMCKLEYHASRVLQVGAADW